MSPLHNIGRRAKTIGGKPFKIDNNTMLAQPAQANICPPFSEWTLVGNATVVDGVLKLNAIGAGATSPLLPILGQPGWGFSAECYGHEQSPYSGHPIGVASRVWSSQHFAADGITPALNTSGYAGNGNADDIPLGTWGDRYKDGGYWANSAGPNVHYVKIIIPADKSWVSPPVEFRRPMMVISGQPAYTHYYKKGLPQ